MKREHLRVRTKRKFMIEWSDETDRQMKKIAKTRHIALQELLRAIVIPEWLDSQKAKIPARKKK